MPEIVLALDVDKNKAMELIDKTSGILKFFKVGQALFAEAPEIAGIINKAGAKILLDLKYNDIPSVIALAIKKASEKFCPFGFTLHISGGKKMLQAAAEARDSIPKENMPVLFGVTVLTSLDTADLQALGVNTGGAFSLTEHIVKLSKFANECGINGVVCSGKEIGAVKNANGKSFLTLVPGLSAGDAIMPDQKRTFTIKEAAAAGGDYLVVGRAITGAADPVDAAIKAMGEIKC